MEVLRIVEETLDAYFSMPLAQFPDLLEVLVEGADRCLASYAAQALTSCGEYIMQQGDWALDVKCSSVW